MEDVLVANLGQSVSLYKSKVAKAYRSLILTNCEYPAIFFLVKNL